MIEYSCLYKIIFLLHFLQLEICFTVKNFCLYADTEYRQRKACHATLESKTFFCTSHLV